MKAVIETKYRFTIARIDAYDTPRCENFVRMIAHKNIKDTVEKWYNNILIKYGCKLLTKKPKTSVSSIIAKICINHPIVDNTFPPSYIYIVKTMLTVNDSINTFNGGTNTFNEKFGDDFESTEQPKLFDSVDDFDFDVGKRFLHCCIFILMTLTFF